MSEYQERQGDGRHFRVSVPETVDIMLRNGGEIDDGNTSSVALGASAVFTGTGVDVSEYATIIVSLYADKPSATDGLELQFSSDNANWFTSDEYTYRNGGSCKTWSIQTVGRYFRVKYTNGSDAQTSLNLCTILKRFAGVATSHRVADNIEGQDDAALTKTILMAERAGGTQDVYTNINATAGGNLKVSVEEILEGEVVPVSTTFGDTLYMSEFSELRVAEPRNRADVEFIYDKQPLLFDDISAGNGTATHQSSSRDVLLAVGGSDANDCAGMRHHDWIPYTPGSGQEIDITGTMDNADIGGGTAFVFLRSTVSGVTTLQTIAQSAWLSLASGMNWQYSQIFRISFQSLKVGRVQFSIVQGGLPYKVAEITNDNLRSTGYWQFANLPPYWKIYNDGTNTVCEIGYGDELNGVGFRYVYNGTQPTATVRAVCCTVKSQGGELIENMVGYPFSASSGITPRTVGNALLPVLSIQVASTFNALTNRTLIVPQSYSLQTDNAIYYKLVYRPALTGASFSAVNAAYSAANYDVAATALSGGVVVDDGYLTGGSRNQQIVGAGLLSRVLMSLGSTGTADILTLAAIRTTNNDATVYAQIGWKEIR